MATAAFIKFVWIMLGIFCGSAIVVTAFDWYATMVAENDARTRKRIEYQREHRAQDDPKELVKIYFG